MKDLGRAPHLLPSVACGGKLPSMGDFVWSTPDPELRGPLDAWLQTGMHQFRLAYVDQWQAMFDNAPLWNFIVPAGGLSKDCIIGCLSPSCDRVGRRFPFVVAFPLPSRMAPWQMTSVVNSTPVLLSPPCTGLLISRQAIQTFSLCSWMEASIQTRPPRFPMTVLPAFLGATWHPTCVPPRQ